MNILFIVSSPYDSRATGIECIIHSIQQTETQHNPFKRMQQLYLGLGCTTRFQNIWGTSTVLKLKNSNLSLASFSTPFLTSQKCQTMSPHQEAIASSTSSLIWGLKEFTTVVESPTRPWNSLSCFEATPSIQVSMYPLHIRSERYRYCIIHGILSTV